MALTLMNAQREDAARHAAASDVATRQMGNVNRLLDALLDVSRLDLGLTACGRELVDLTAVVGEAREQCDALFERHQVALACEVPRATVQVIGDRLRLVQALTNVLANAGKYTPAGGRVQLALRVDQHQALLSVEDNGRGIEADALPHVFQSFMQEHRSLEPAQGGLGLGLSVVQKIVALHGGRVTAESAGAGRGSRFVIALPLAGAEAAPGV